MSIEGLRFVERNQKRILQQKVVIGIQADSGEPFEKWQDVPLEEECKNAAD